MTPHRKWRNRNQAKGLTADGKPRARPIRDDNWRRKLARRCSLAYRQRLIAMGLTSRGQPPKRTGHWESMWKRFKASLNCNNHQQNV